MSNRTETRKDTPTLLPPQARSRAGRAGTTIDLEGQTRPKDFTLPPGRASGRSGAAPALSPPGTAGASADIGALTGTWTSSITVDASWIIAETRNAWFHVAGGGWKRIFNGSDGAFMALTMLVTQAKQTQHQIAIREEADGMVHEVYLW